MSDWYDVKDWKEEQGELLRRVAADDPSIKILWYECRKEMENRRGREREREREREKKRERERKRKRERERERKRRDHSA